MTEILFLRLEAPWQAWGSRAHWDVRDTQSEPTKSGIMGLLGCALGYSSTDIRLVDELDAGFRFGVRVEAPGQVVEDYQTVTDFLPTADGGWKHSGLSVGRSLVRLRKDPSTTPSTIISPRQYLEDAAFLVALEQQPAFPGLARRCAQALQHSRWPLYLGRKACVPTRPVFEQLVNNYANLEDALTQYPWSWSGANGEPRARPAGPCAVWLDDATGTARRRDVMRINPARQYAYRQVRRILVVPP